MQIQFTHAAQSSNSAVIPFYNVITDAMIKFTKQMAASQFKFSHQVFFFWEAVIRCCILLAA
jgi:hypothetical protein